MMTKKQPISLPLCLVLLALPAFSAVETDSASDRQLTYSKDVASILNEKCVRCHRPDQGAPMTLGSYEEVRPWVKSIARQVKEGTMPPLTCPNSQGNKTGYRKIGITKLPL